LPVRCSREEDDLRPYDLAVKLWRRAMARPVFHKFHRSLHHFSLIGLGVGNAGNDRDSGEAWLLAAMGHRLRGRKPIVVDVGGHHGDWAEALLAVCPDADLYTYEPHPSTFARLSQRLKGRVKGHYRLALGAKAGTVKLWDYPGAGSEHASLHQGVFSEVHQKKARAVQIQIRSLDFEMARLRLPRVDFLKIDTEGHELSVLQGARRALAERRIGAIQFEFNAMNVVSRVFFADFLRALPGWTFYRLLPGGLLPLAGLGPAQTEIFGYQNLLALPPGEFLQA
jgi:FkbM family methyltransferase